MNETDWGQYYGVDGFTYNLNFNEKAKADFQAAKIKAGNTDWSKILDYVFTYGDRAVSILSKNGIIPNKNVQSILQANYDKNALNEFLAANGGSLTATPENLKERSANNQILGLNTSTLVLIGAGILLFMVSKK